MNQPAKTITREELYEAVWSNTIKRLAQEWNTTYLRLVQACQEMEVPRPSQGHWQLVARGKTIEKEPLPDRTGNIPNELVFLPQGATPVAGGTVPKKQGAKPKPAEQTENVETEKQPKVEVPKDLSNAHHLVKLTKKALSTDTYVHNGFVNTRSRLDQPLRIMVSPGGTDRALRILDAIIKGIIERGGRFERGPESWRLRLFIGKEPVEFHVREAMKRHDHPFTAEEREAPGFSWRYKYDWVGSGSLRFQIHGGECVHERAWEDSRKSKLEDQVEDIVETLANIEEEAKQIRAAREERKKQQEEEWRRREEQRRKQEQIQKEAEHRRRIEEENRKRLEEKAQAWREARILRRFVHACEAVLRKKGKPFPANGWEGRWLVWAREHADRLDPMTSGFLEAEERRLTAPEQDGNGSKLEDMSLGAKMQGMMFGENFP